MAFVTSRISSIICRSPTLLRIAATPSTSYARPAPAPFTRRFASDGSPAKDAEPALKLSETCVAKLREICADGTHLRIQVDGGGCSGFQYKFDLTTETNEDDIKFGPDGRVVIDSISLDYCAGSTLDYHVELIKSGFRMTSNPKAEQGCSCGASFALKM